MAQALIITFLFAYKAFMADLMFAVVPEKMTENKLINDYYISEEHEADYEIKKNIELIKPLINAESSLAIDVETNKILFSKGAYKKRQIASITKLMTAILAVEHLEMDEIVEVSRESSLAIGSSMNLFATEKLRVEALLKGVLVKSANDAAFALAEKVSGTEREFVDLMNEKAKELGLFNTHFTNCIGLDSYKNHSTAFDVYLLAKEAFKIDKIKEMVALTEATVKNQNGREYYLKSTNKNLNSFLNIIGGKTGTTDAAGESLVNLLKTKDNHEVIIVLLNSPRRFSEAKILGEWIERAYRWEE